MTWNGNEMLIYSLQELSVAAWVQASVWSLLLQFVCRRETSPERNAPHLHSGCSQQPRPLPSGIPHPDKWASLTTTGGVELLLCAVIWKWWERVQTVSIEAYRSCQEVFWLLLIYLFQNDRLKTEDGTVSNAAPDICIAYKLHLECGRLINLCDWLEVSFVC